MIFTNGVKIKSVRCADQDAFSFMCWAGRATWHAHDTIAIVIAIAIARAGKWGLDGNYATPRPPGVAFPTLQGFDGFYGTARPPSRAAGHCALGAASSSPIGLMRPMGLPCLGQLGAPPWPSFGRPE